MNPMKRLFGYRVPKLEKFLGRMVRIPGETVPIQIKDIRGNIGLSMGRENPRPQFYEINGKYLIGMLRFHAQMEGDTSISEQEFQDFENIEFHAEVLPKKAPLIELPPRKTPLND